MSSDRYSTVNILNQHFLLDGFLLVLENGSAAVFSGGFILKGKEETTDINWKMLWLVNMSNWSIKEKIKAFIHQEQVLTWHYLPWSKLRIYLVNLWTWSLHHNICSTHYIANNIKFSTILWQSTLENNRC